MEDSALPVMPWKCLYDLDLTDLQAPARIESITEVPADGDRGAYAEVRGYAAPAVGFAIRLPLNSWNGRFLMRGQGGYGGRVSFDLWKSAPENTARLLGGEFAIAVHDGGHRSSERHEADGLWALGNPQAIADMAYQGGHKVVLVAKAIIEAFYGMPPHHSYFVGCSAAGRAALQHAQRYPEDFDGIAAEAPNIDMVSTNTFWHAWNTRANADSEGRPILTADRIGILHHAVLDAATTSGASDGEIVLDPRLVAFDPWSLVEKGQLTPEQAQAAARLYAGPADEDGQPLSAGGLVLGSEPAWIGNAVPADGETITEANSMDYRYSVDFPQYMATLEAPTGITNQNMHFDGHTFDQLDELSGWWDPTNPDLSAFRERGGRLLIWQGWADPSVSPYATLNYCHAVRDFMGARAEDVLALFMVPGANHCGYGPTTVQADYLTPLIAWVERGERPEEVTAEYEGVVPGHPHRSSIPRHRPTVPTLLRRPPGTVAEQFPWAGLHHYTPEHTSWYGGTFDPANPASQSPRQPTAPSNADTAEAGPWPS